MVSAVRAESELGSGSELCELGLHDSFSAGRGILFKVLITVALARTVINLSLVSAYALFSKEHWPYGALFVRHMVAR